MKPLSLAVLGLFAVSAAFGSRDVVADGKECKLLGSCGYLYNGTSYGPAGPISLTESGDLVISKNLDINGHAKLERRVPGRLGISSNGNRT